MGLLMDVYHRLPAPARSAAATARGATLRWWRYGPDAEDLVDAALERDTWSSAEWSAYTETQTGELLTRAAAAVPAHQGRPPDDLQRWPLMTKHDLRREPMRFVAEDRDPRRCFVDRTSGTSGTPLSIYMSRRDVREWYALYEARLRRWNGVSRHERWTMTGGQLVVPLERTEPPYWVRNHALHQLYLSTMHISEASTAEYAGALRTFRPTHMIGYPSSVSLLARAANEQSIELPTLRVFLSNAEALSPGAREAIGAAFGCPVRDTYGMGEAAVGATECANGSMHLWQDGGLVEVLDEGGQPVAPGDTGELVVTGFRNATMPLIRYRTGDRGRLVGPDEPPCPCGRVGPRLAEIEGRTNDLLVTADGRKVFWVNPIFYGLALVEAQVTQEADRSIRVAVVPDTGWSDQDGEELLTRLRTRVGDLPLRLDTVAAIERGPNGKFRAIVSLVEDV